jgi:hypothetical protein
MSSMQVNKFETHIPQEPDAYSDLRILLYLQRDHHTLDSLQVSPVCVF